MTRRRRILLLAMYELREQRSGPTVRITNLHRALQQHLDVDLISGARGERRAATWRYVLSGRLRGVDGVYVESSTALPSESDLAALLLARSLGHRVITYVRDAYQLFPDWYRADSPKRWLSARAFRPAMRALQAVSTSLAFPTRGLADAVVGPRRAALLLPPGAPPPTQVPRAPDARDLLFVGDLRTPEQGGALLIPAMALARQRGAEIGLIAVVRPGDEPAGKLPDWVRVERATSSEIPGLLSTVLGTVIARPPSAYADLALPIKLGEYLSYGRPIVTTNRRETAAVVRHAGCGLVADDGIEGLSEAIRSLAVAPITQIDAWSASAARAAVERSWDHVARAIIAGLDA